MNIGLPERRAALRAAQYEGCQATLAFAAGFFAGLASATWLLLPRADKAMKAAQSASLFMGQVKRLNRFGVRFSAIKFRHGGGDAAFEPFARGVGGARRVLFDDRPFVGAKRFEHEVRGADALALFARRLAHADA